MAIAAAEIRYTIDGSTPSASSLLYSGGALNLTGTPRLRAQAYVGGTASGKPTTSLHIARAIDATHDPPVVVHDSYGSGRLPTDEAQRVFVDVGYLSFELNGGTVSLSGAPTVSSLADSHVRGNSSAMFDKVPYRVELSDESGKDRDCALF